MATVGLRRMLMLCLPLVVGATGLTAAGQEAGEPPASFESQFWKFLHSAKYQNWAPLPGVGADMYPGKSPHGDFVKLFANRTAAGDPKACRTVR